MPIVKNILRRGKLTKQNLDTFDVFVDEKGVVGSLATSEYFKISNVPSDFVRGNQFFQLEGSDLLKPEVELKTEILDSEGNPIFHYAKLKRLNERLTSIVVEIYEDVAPGQGKLILLGELNPERVNVPTEFLNTYNVRFSAPINIDVEKSNTQPIRFFGSPRLDVKENVKGIVKEKPQQSTYEEFTYTISGSGALSDDGVGFREFFEWIDAPNPIGFTSGSGFDDFSDNLADIKNFQSKLNSSNFNDQEKQNKKKIKSYYSVDPVPPSFIASSISNGPGVNDNKFNLTIEAGKLKLLNPHLSVNNTDFPDDEYDKPTTFETSFKVGNSSQLLIGSGYKIIRKSDGKRASVPLSSVNYELTYEQVITSKTEDPDYFRSYADITVGNLRTFSGDVYRAKIFSNPRGSIGDSELIADVVLESQQQLVDKDSLSGRENIGIFYSQSIVDNYWISSSEGVATQNDDTIAGSVILSGSVKPYDSSMTFITSQSYDLVRDEDYIVEFDGYFFKSDSNDSSGNTTPDAELEVFLTGSAISSQIQEFSLGTIDNQSTLLKNRVSGSLNGIYNTFKTHNELSIPNTKLGFRLKKGRFALQNVVLRPFADTNFNPGFFKTSVPMPQVIKRGQRYDFTAKFYDINNNEADGVLAHTTQSIIFNGPPQVIADGLDAKLSGSMLIGESLEMYGVNPAYLRSVGYNGFDSTISNNKGGFMLFSGSVGTRITASESYEGVGLEIVDAHGSVDRYLKFRTNPSQFEVVTDTFFLGQDPSVVHTGSFISGSQGNLQISSSNFSVDTAGNVTMSGFISASGGHIGNFQIVEGKISGSNITMDANTSTIFKTDQGPGSDTSAPFDQLRDEYYIDFTPTEEAPDNYYIKFGPNFMVDKDGILIASGATFEGSITASTGLIGGFTIGSASLFNGSEGTPNFFFSGSANGSNFDKGNLFISSSGFQVNSQGAMSASSGQIGGFNINTDGLNSDSNEFQITGSTGQVTGSQVLFTGGKIGGFEIVSSVDAIRSTDKSLILSGSGQITGSTVLFTGGKVGGWTLSNNTISSNNLIIDSSGLIETSNFVSGLRGFRLSAANNGFLEVEQAKIRGTLATTVFEKESINSVGGQLIVANSTTITGSNEVSASQVTMSVANVTGFEQNEILLLKKISGTGFNTEYVLVNSSSRDGTNDNDTQGRIMVTRGYGTSETFNGAKHSGSISEVANNATTYEPGQVIVSTGKIDTGYIRLNANPNDTTTPYIDIVERTGSGIFDVDLKARLGDLSGLSSGLVGSNPGFGLFSENVFLTGKITATSGQVGGWTINSSTLTGGDATIDSSGNLTLGTSGNVVRLSADNSTHRLWVGNATAGSAPFRVTKGGALTATGATINGTITLNASSDLSATDFYSDVNSTTGSLESFSGSAQGNLDTLGQHTSSMNTRTGSLDTLETRVVINNQGMHLRNQGGDTLATYGTNIVLGSTGSNEENVFIDANSVDVRSGTNVLSSFGSTTTIGSTSDSHIQISGSGLTLNDGGTQKFSIQGSGVTVGRPGESRTTITQNDISLFGGTTAEKRVEINNSGKLILGKSSDNRVEIEDTSFKLYEGSNERINIISTGVQIKEDANNFAEVSASGMSVFAGGNRVSQFASDIKLFGGSITLQGGTNDHEKLVLDNASVALYANNQKKVDINDSGISIGPGATAGSDVVGTVRVDGNAVTLFGDNTNTFTKMSSAGLEVTEDGNKKAIFGPISVIGSDGAAVTPTSTDDCIRISDGTITFFNSSTTFSEISSVGLRVFKGDASNPVSIFGTSATIGEGSSAPSGEQHQILLTTTGGATGITVKDGDNDVIAFIGSSAEVASRTSGDVLPNAAAVRGIVTDGLTANSLQITGSANVGGLVTSGSVRNTSTGAATSVLIHAENNSQTLFQVSDEGAVLARDNISAFTSAFTSISDKRLKTNVQTMTGSMDKILQLRPTKFTWKENGKTDTGFIAQEVEKIIPDVVYETKGFTDINSGKQDDEMYKTISYNKLTTYLVDTIQQLTKRIEDLEKQNTKIEVD